MKRGLGGAIGLGMLAMVVGCAAIANLQDPSQEEDELSPLPSSDAARDPSTSPPAAAATSTAEAPDSASPEPVYDAGPPSAVDAGPTPVQCVNPDGAANSDPCRKPSDCCSGKCIESRVCVNSCIAPGKACNPVDNSTCCVGSYCTAEGVFSCVPCRESGAPAERDPLLGLPVGKSCCSRSAKFDGTCS